LIYFNSRNTASRRPIKGNLLKEMDES
jgi:hypothetical protein